MPIRLTIFFSGHVQGVGFRYRTVQEAQAYQVTGWVRNERDGRVQAVIEGEKGEVESFVSTLRQRLAEHIDSIDQKWSDASSEWSEFRITR